MSRTCKGGGRDLRLACKVQELLLTWQTQESEMEYTQGLNELLGPRSNASVKSDIKPNLTIISICATSIDNRNNSHNNNSNIPVLLLVYDDYYPPLLFPGWPCVSRSGPKRRLSLVSRSS